MKHIVLVVLALGSVLLAEKADMKPEHLRKASTHVVTGKVKAIYTKQEREGDWFYTRYCAEVEVAASEKGEGVAPGSLVYVRYWTRKYRGKGRVISTAGYRGLPTEGQTLRIYLARNAYDGFYGKEKNSDGGFNVIGANGFEAIK